MRIFVFLTILFLAGIEAQAEDSLKIQVRNKWCNHKDSIFVYDGGFNVLQVFGKDIDPKDVTLRSHNHHLRLDIPEVKGDTVNITAMPMEIGNAMKVSVVHKKTGRVLKEVTVYSEARPEPRARLGNTIRGGVVDKKLLLDESYMRVFYPNSSYCYPYKILGYTFKAKKGNVPMEVEVKGFDIPVEVKTLIKGLPTNGVAEFTNIMAVCPECYDKKLKDIKIVIK